VIRFGHRWGGGRGFTRVLGSGRAWYWPLGSVLMLAVIVGVLLALPSANAAHADGVAGASVASANTPVRRTLDVVVIGDFFSYGYASSADPALRLSVPPTLAALNQVQLADQSLQLHVLFIPVSEATWGKLYKSSGPGKAPLINAVKGANLVVAGVGADVPKFAGSLRSILFGTHVSAKMYPPMLGIFRNGSYQQEETAFLEDIAAREASGGALVTLGYPQVQQAHQTWWSPLSWSTVGRKQAHQTNHLVSVLDTANAAATRAAGTQYQDQHLLYADASATPSGASARGAQAIALKETLIGNSLLPYVTQGVDDELSSMGMQGPRDVSPITPSSRWVLTVQLPTGVRGPLTPSRSGPGHRRAPMIRVAPTGQRLANAQASPENGRRAPVTIRVPMIPAPPAPTPKPIAPLTLPAAIGGGTGGSGTSNSAGAGANSGPGSTSTGGGSGSQGNGTTSSGNGTTSPGNGTASSGAGGTSSGAGTSSGGGSSSGGGGSSSGGGSGS
jgi:hypothetical protein